jgi:hypothetical protein
MTEDQKVKTPRQKLFEELESLAIIYGSTIEQVLSSDTKWKTCRVREELMFYVYEKHYDHTNWSYVKIGRLFNRHHTAVRRAVAKAMSRNGMSSHKLVKMEKVRYEKVKRRNRLKAMEDRVYG